MDEGRLGTTVRVLGGTGRGPVARWLAGGDHLLGGLRPLVGPHPALVVAAPTPHPGQPDAVSAWAEAAVVHLRRQGTPLHIETHDHLVRTRRDLVARFTRHGEDSVAVWREQPSLLAELRLGSWYAAGWRARLARRALLLSRFPATLLPPRVAADVAFWRGVRAAATGPEWQRLARSSYVVLCYHRLAGLALPGQERMDVAPAALRRQLRLLAMLGWRPLSVDEVVAFHRDHTRTLPARRYLLTADDAFAEAVAELTRHGRRHPVVFVVTGSVGATAEWLDHEQVADRRALESFVAAGGTLGSHARHHVRLDRQDPATLRAELAGSAADLVGRTGSAHLVLAYPHGGHDAAAREAARDCGYAAAFTTRKGRNGAGTDPWCLRRVEPKIWDSSLTFLWKVVTGESPPARWNSRRSRRWVSRRPGGGPTPPARAARG